MTPGLAAAPIAPVDADAQITDADAPTNQVAEGARQCGSSSDSPTHKMLLPDVVGRSDLAEVLLEQQQPGGARPPPQQADRMRARTLSWDQMLADEAAPKTIGRRIDDTAGASFRSTVSNLVSTCLGSGMLALPAMLGRLGLGGGLTLLLMMTLVAERTVSLLVSSADLTGHASLAAVAEASLGTSGAVLTAVALIALNAGVCVSYCVVIKTLLPDVVRSLLHLASPPPVVACLAAVCVGLLWPLSSLSSMDELRWASLASIALIYAFVAAVCAAGAHVLLYAEPGLWEAWLSQPLIRGSLADWAREVPVACFSFLCHPNVLYLYDELRRQKRRASPSRYTSKRSKMMAATRVCYAACSLIYAAEAVGGYAAFGRNAQPDLLENLRPGPECPLPQVVVQALHAAFVTSMITTFPSLSFSLRGSLHALCFSAVEETRAWRLGESALIVGLVGCVAAAIDDLGLVFQLVGATCGSLLMFVLPALIFLRGRAQAEGEGRGKGAAGGGGGGGTAAAVEGGRGRSAVLASALSISQTTVAWFVLLFGAVVFIAGTVTVVLPAE